MVTTQNQAVNKKQINTNPESQTWCCAYHDAPYIQSHIEQMLLAEKPCPLLLLVGHAIAISLLNIISAIYTQWS